MHETAEHDHISLNEAVRIAPGDVSPNCLRRWCRRGVLSRSGGRIKLQHVRVVGKLFTTAKWIDEFGKRLAEADAGYFDRIEDAATVPLVRLGHEPSTLGNRRFATHVGRVPPESLDRLDTWFPEDSVDVQYSTTGDGHERPACRYGLRTPARLLPDRLLSIDALDAGLRDPGGPARAMAGAPPRPLRSAVAVRSVRRGGSVINRPTSRRPPVSIAFSSRRRG